MNTQATQNQTPKTTEEHLDRIFRLLMVMAVMVAAIVIGGYLALSGLVQIP